MTDLDPPDLTALVGRLTLEQKVRLLTGADFWALNAEPEIGLRRVVTSDGPAGVRGELWDERDTSANLPSPTALAATWDDALLAELGHLLASEARRKGVDVVLAPTVNLHRSPYGGRHFECFSEDPVLTARVGAAIVRAMQDDGVAATVKHFVANDSESDRLTVDMRIDERTLREVYLAPFEVIVRDAGAWAVMAAYNQVNGTTMTESPLLRDVLHAEWGFDGVTMSDWYATRSTVATAVGGLDLAMPGPTGPWGDLLVEAVRDGQVSEEAVDDKVRRLLRLAHRVGALEPVTQQPLAPRTPEDTHALVRRAAAAGFVMVRNEPVGGVPALPLNRPELRRVAVVGPNAHPGRTLGGGSAFVFPDREISPVDGLREAFGEDVVVYAEGVRAHHRIGIADPAHLSVPGSGAPGVRIRFVDRDGDVLATDERTGTAYNWNNAFVDGVAPEKLGAIEMTTVLTAPETGEYRVGFSGLGQFRMLLGGDVAVDELLVLPEGADPVEGLMRPPQRGVDVALAEGESVELTVVRTITDHTPGSDLLVSLQLNADLPYPGDEAAIAHAVDLARVSDVAVVVVGTNEEVESEGFDRDSLDLPGRQDELVRRVAAANPRTVVVVNAGAPVVMPWRDEVAAVLLSWFPGQEFGHALADLLTGVVEPGGRLPTTWPATESEVLPSTRPVDGALAYDEGLHVGYRRFLRDAVAPAYWFGHGLGYTTWSYDALDVAGGPDDAVARVTVRNTGDRSGRELVQAYVAREGSAVERPTRWLASYAWVGADPGETVTVEVPLPRRTFEHWDTDAGAWTIEPGGFLVQVGRGAGDIVLEASTGW
ncbi:glycosyl hydrolase [Mumia zhuanghuii]|uniref:Glycoside hydrolase family 3 protein n=2 Tax=Mumia TaxID=1546255 RepID=A0ABW1QK19_9ACTN|nr:MULTISPECIES: glycoside hydrolase family 3 C-terminal domain-containing protein [Mumia]KAA1418239.1 glycosyl hydrolase [Mumia zhuanghuii]